MFIDYLKYNNCVTNFNYGQYLQHTIEADIKNIDLHIFNSKT